MIKGLRFLVRISTDLGMPVAADFAGRLTRLEGRQMDSGSTPEPEAFTEFVKIRSEVVPSSGRVPERGTFLCCTCTHV